MIRLKDIAARAGVSVMTVSKVLRDAPDISPATKARIKLLAEEMGYVPDSIAQGLRTRTTKLIGVVLSSVTNPVFARSILAIEEHAYEIGYEVVLAHHLNDPAREETMIRRLLSRRVDGFIISPVYRLSPSAPIFDELIESGIPTVILGHKPAFCGGLINVETDDSGGSQQATQHLLELGHRRIAFLAGPSAAPWAQERFDGYRKGLREAGVEFDETLVFNAGTSIEHGTTAALQMMHEGTNVTAVQACNDLVAIGAASVFLKQGHKIPANLSIVGFGDVLISEHYQVPLTTVHQPKFRLGNAAMEVLRKLMKKQPVDPQRLQTELVVRASTAKASAN